MKSSVTRSNDRCTGQMSPALSTFSGCSTMSFPGNPFSSLPLLPLFPCREAPHANAEVAHGSSPHPLPSAVRGVYLATWLFTLFTIVIPSSSIRLRDLSRTDPGRPPPAPLPDAGRPADPLLPELAQAKRFARARPCRGRSPRPGARPLLSLSILPRPPHPHGPGLGDHRVLPALAPLWIKDPNTGYQP